MAWVLFFDGDCGFCNQSVRRLARWDREGVIHYAPLQGKLASKHGLGSHLEGSEASMVMLNEEDGTVLMHSDGMLQILRILGGAWRLFLFIGWFPKSFRDKLYRCLARNRHRIRSTNAQVCEMPGKDLASRIRE